MLLCEAGKVTEPVNMMLQKEGPLRAGRQQVYWGHAETVAAFRYDVEVDPLACLIGTHGQAIERFKVFGATEHGRKHLLIISYGQPRSHEDDRQPSQQMFFCQYILSAAIQHCAEDENCVGVGIGGNANATIT